MKTQSSPAGCLRLLWFFLTLSLSCLRPGPVYAQWIPAINITNHTWKYLVQGTDPGVEWRYPEYDDSSWNQGRGLFGFEGQPAVYPHPFQTIWQPLNDRVAYYVRTRFYWPLTWPNVRFRTTNYIDDGAVFYLNGERVGQVRLTNEVVDFNTVASPPAVEGQPDVLEFRSSLMHPGDNLLAVEIHNSSSLSGDIVFGLSMEGIECHFDVFATATPPFQTVEECRPATITLALPKSFLPGMKWFKNGVPIPSATSNVLVFPHVSLADMGSYYVQIPTPCDLQYSSPSVLVVTPDQRPPLPQQIVPDPNPTNLTVAFSEPLNAASVQPANFVVDDLCQTGSLAIQQATLLNATNVLLTTSPRVPGRSYQVTVSGVSDACAGNVLETNVTVATRQGELTVARSLAGLRLSWTDCGVLQWTSNLVDWAEVPDAPVSPYSVEVLAGPRFYRLRTP